MKISRHFANHMFNFLLFYCLVVMVLILFFGIKKAFKNQQPRETPYHTSVEAFNCLTV